MSEDRLKDWLRGHDDAIAFIQLIHEIAEIWDDLIDKDNPVSDSAIDGAFYRALVTLPRNGFYRQHFALLSPILEAAILDWFAANDLERRRAGDDLRTAYVLRCGAQALTVMAARIIGGVEWARRVNLELRSSGDSWAEYSQELEARHGLGS
ncbi:MAG: hypothetical protein ACXWCQ_35110 [Burkholderiales bacterium]